MKSIALIYEFIQFWICHWLKKRELVGFLSSHKHYFLHFLSPFSALVALIPPENLHTSLRHAFSSYYQAYGTHWPGKLLWDWSGPRTPGCPALLQDQRTLISCTSGQRLLLQKNLYALRVDTFFGLWGTGCELRFSSLPGKHWAADLYPRTQSV